MAYTRTDLREEIPLLNRKLETVRPGFHFEVEGRNGYTGLDLYNGTTCSTNIKCGSPRECAEAAYRYVVANMNVS